jgi:hypothetical protein
MKASIRFYGTVFAEGEKISFASKKTPDWGRP